MTIAILTVRDGRIADIDALVDPLKLAPCAPRLGCEDVSEVPAGISQAAVAGPRWQGRREPELPFETIARRFAPNAVHHVLAGAPQTFL